MSRKLWKARVLNNITQIKLSIRTGVPQSKISLIENGYVEPTADEKRKLAKALGKRLEELFDEN